MPITSCYVISEPNDSTANDPGPEPALVHEEPDNLEMSPAGKEPAGLTKLEAFKLDGSDKESLSAEVIQPHTLRDKIAPGLMWRK